MCKVETAAEKTLEKILSAIYKELDQPTTNVDTIRDLSSAFQTIKSVLDRGDK